MLMLWLCAPALLATLAAQAWFFWRHGIRRWRRIARAVIAVAVTVVVAPIVAVLFWLTLPQALLPSSVEPALVPPIFLPAVLACSILGPVLAWWGIRRGAA